MFVLRTPEEMAYIPVAVEVMKTSKPKKPEIKKMRMET